MDHFRDRISVFDESRIIVARGMSLRWHDSRRDSSGHTCTALCQHQQQQSPFCKWTWWVNWLPDWKRLASHHVATTHVYISLMGTFAWCLLMHDVRGIKSNHCNIWDYFHHEFSRFNGWLILQTSKFLNGKPHFEINDCPMYLYFDIDIRIGSFQATFLPFIKWQV